MQTSVRRSRLGAAAGVAGVIILLVIVGIVLSYAARRGDAAYPVGSPEATLSAYLRLLQDGQVDRAYALVDPATGSTLQEFHQQYDAWNQRSHRVALVRSTVAGRSASITIDVTTFSAGSFGASDYSSRQTFTLTHAPGGWRITAPAYLY